MSGSSEDFSAMLAMIPAIPVLEFTLASFPPMSEVVNAEC
jgi:hypothetical protein